MFSVVSVCSGRRSPCDYSSWCHWSVTWGATRPRPVHNSSLETHPQLIHCELPVQTVQTLFILASERLAFRLKGFLFLSVSRLCWDGSEIDITSGWVHRASNLMFTLRSDKDQRKKLLSLSFGVNEPLVSTKYLYLLYSFSSTNLSLADRGGVALGTRSPGPISFIFMQFSTKILPNNRFSPPNHEFAPPESVTVC